MAGPEMVAIMMGAQLMGSMMSAGGQMQAGEEQAKAYEYNAAVTEQKGIYEENAARDRLKRLLGTQRSLYAKAGVDISSGSPLLLMAETAAEGEMEALNIKRGYMSEAALNRFYGKQAKGAGMIGGISTFMSGLGNVGTQYASQGGFKSTSYGPKMKNPKTGGY